MENPYRGEVLLVLNGVAHFLKLTLGALAELETALETDSLLDLVERFESGRFSSADLLHLLAAGLRGGGWKGELPDLLSAEIEGGPVGAARIAARLLAVSFSVDHDAD